MNQHDQGRLAVKGAPLLFSLIALTVLLALIFGLVQYSFPDLIGYDGSFHIKYSALLRDAGFIDSLPWLQYTIHADEYRDHHLLFHYLLIPFTLGDLVQGGKTAAIAFAVILGLTVFYVYRRSGVAYAPLFALLSLLASAPFIYRASMLRVQSLSLALLLLVFYFSMARRYGAVFVLSIVFVWYYDAFPLLLFVVGAMVLSMWLVEHEFDWRLALAPVLGILAGMIVNPYFPENVVSLGYNIYRTLFLDVADVNLGTEWDPYDTWALVTNSLPAFALLSITVLSLPLVKQFRSEEYAALLLNLAFLFLTLKSRRFVEYWPVFAFLTGALILGRRLPGRYLLPGLLLLVPLSILNVREAASLAENDPPAAMYQGAATWLRENTEPGSVVFNADWDDFPFLFHYNTDNYYIVGLDPMYMLSFDEEKYRLYQKITRGQVKRPGALIMKEFNAHSVFLDKDHGSLHRRLLKDPTATKVYEDEWTWVFRLTEAPAGPSQGAGKGKPGRTAIGRVAPQAKPVTVAPGGPAVGPDQGAVLQQENKP